MGKSSIVDTMQTLCTEAVRFSAGINEATFDSLVAYWERRSKQIEGLLTYERSVEEQAACQTYVQQLLAADAIIRRKMDEFRQEAKHELDILRDARKQQAGYEHQAELQQPLESLFFDQKK